MRLPPSDMAAVGYFRQANCGTCHSIGEGAAKAGPDLTRVVVKKDVAWFAQHFKQSPETLSDKQVKTLAAFMVKLGPDNATALQYAPEFAAQGAQVYEANHCNACHSVNGVGAKAGPPLNGIAKRQSRSWVEAHFADPQRLSPGSFMPPYKLAAKDMLSLTSYLFSLPEKGNGPAVYPTQTLQPS